MPVERYDAATWRRSGLASRRWDLTRLASEKAAVAEICARVQAEGDAALRELGRRYDGWAPTEGESFEVPGDELVAAAGRLRRPERAALEFAAGRIAEIHR